MKSLILAIFLIILGVGYFVKEVNASAMNKPSAWQTRM
jgi:hypothetical protein